MSGIVMPAAVSISLSASTKAMPSRSASRRPIEDLPAPIMPTSTTERAPSAATIAARIGGRRPGWRRGIRPAWAAVGFVL